VLSENDINTSPESAMHHCIFRTFYHLLCITQEVVLIENDINTSPFTPAVHECVPTLPWHVTEEDMQQPGRADLRHLAVCSVDPPGCKDIDDALHVRCCRDAQFVLLRCAICEFLFLKQLKNGKCCGLWHLAVCSVDPPGCKDIDDALHVRCC